MVHEIKRASPVYRVWHAEFQRLVLITPALVQPSFSAETINK